MTGHTYLLKSRHGIYYFRVTIPKWYRSHLGSAKRELRVSLRTKDKFVAKQRVALKVLLMSQEFDAKTEIEADAAKRQATLTRGLTLMGQMGNLAPDNELDLDALCEELSPSDLEAYVFAHEHKQSKALGGASDAATILPSLNKAVSLLEKVVPVDRHPPTIVLAAPEADVAFARRLSSFESSNYGRGTAEQSIGRANSRPTTQAT